jgi:K+-sensing histidine kinase KdpD
MLSSEELLHEIMREVELIDHLLVKQSSLDSGYLKIKKSTSRIKYFYSQNVVTEKFSSNKFHISNINTSLSDLIFSSLDEVKVVFDNHYSEIKTEIESNIFLEIDPLLARIVFLNLLENAFKYGTGILSIKLYRDNSTFRFELVNSYQLKDPNIFSTNNGLLIVRKMIEKLGGLYEEKISYGQWHTSIIFNR